MRYHEIISESRTIEKFWVHPATREIVRVDDEHDDEIGLSVPDNPIANGWVRGGLSELTNCYHLEAASAEALVAALKVLLRDYGDADGLYYDVTHDGQTVAGGQLDKRQMRRFIASGVLP